MRSTFSKKLEKRNLITTGSENMILENPDFFSFGGLRVFRSWRIDPSRQVSMSAARAGLPSTIYGIKTKEKHKQIQKWTENVNNNNPYIQIPYISPIDPLRGLEASQGYAGIVQPLWMSPVLTPACTRRGSHSHALGIQAWLMLYDRASPLFKAWAQHAHGAVA